MSELRRPRLQIALFVGVLGLPLSAEAAALLVSGYGTSEIKRYDATTGAPSAPW